MVQTVAFVQGPRTSEYSCEPFKSGISVSSVLYNHLEGLDREGGREMQEGGDMGIYVYV